MFSAALQLALLLCCTFAAGVGVEAFAIPASSSSLANPARSLTTTSLALVPSQGAQLAAAGSCAYDDDTSTGTAAAVADVDDSKRILPPVVVPEEEVTVPGGASRSHKARSFVARVFSLPTTLLHPKERNGDHHGSNNNEDSGVLYPVVGFQFVKGNDAFCRALPTTSNPSCRLHPTNEVVVGYYSPACYLDCEGDEATYSQMPPLLP